MKTKRISFLGIAFLATVGVASAHPGHYPADNFAAGILHPLSGWDHILAMVAVGMWAAQLHAVWRIPAAFVAAMMVGAVAGHYLGAVPAIDQGIAASVLILGLLISGAVQLPIAAAASIVGAFALLHGWAHGAEMPSTAGGLAYGSGFILATIALHAVGVALGYALFQRFPASQRLAGAGLALAGIALALA